MTVTWQYEVHVHVKCVLRIHKATTIDRHTHQQYSDKPNTKFEQDFIKCESKDNTKAQSKVAAVPHLSLEMLQSMVVFRLVLTMRKGSPMAEFWEGSSRVETRSRFRLIRFLKARIWWDNGTFKAGNICRWLWYTRVQHLILIFRMGLCS